MRILSLVNLLSLQAPLLCEKLKNDEILVISPLFDEKLNAKFIKCEIGAISYVLALIAKFAYEKVGKFDAYFENLDEAELSAESNVGCEEIEEIIEFLSNCNEILIDFSLKTHPDSQNISYFLQKIGEIFSTKIIDLDQTCAKFNPALPTNLKELAQFNGPVVFKFQGENFVGGKYFALCAKIKNNANVEISTSTLQIKRKFQLDESIKGTVAYLGVTKLDTYCYEIAKIRLLDD